MVKTLWQKFDERMLNPGWVSTAVTEEWLHDNYIYFRPSLRDRLHDHARYTLQARDPGIVGEAK